MMNTTWFVSDLHLSEKAADRMWAFIGFLQQHVQHAHSLYILGDLFDYWIGDDHHHPHYQPLIQQLFALKRLGIQLFFMGGNRDFLVGNAFMQATGCKLLTDPQSIKLGNQSILLLHGDTLCTDDVDYQQLRQQLRDPQWQQHFLGKPISERNQIAHQLRQQSQQATAQKNEVIMDVCQNEVDRLMMLYDVEIMIHGHTHRPDRHHWQLNQRHCERIVLGDWGSTMWALEAKSVDSHLDFELHQWTTATLESGESKNST